MAIHRSAVRRLAGFLIAPLALTGVAAAPTLSRVADAGALATDLRTASGSTLAARSVWGTDVPRVREAGDSARREVGTRFRVTRAAKATHLRFHKTRNNVGRHRGSLWTAGGTRLASVTFTGESRQGWQTARLARPVPLAKGRTYVVSYGAPRGNFSYMPRQLARGTTQGDGVVRAVGASWAGLGRFPRVNTTSAYYADVVVAPAASAPATSAPSTPASSGYPNAGNTGVPTGTALRRSGSLTVTRDGTVIDRLDIRGTLTINASNVTVKRSRVVGSGFSIIRVKDSARNVTIQDVEINGRGRSGAGNSMGVMGPATVLRADISGVENGLTPGSGSLLKDNYIHDLAAPGSPHIDGVQIDGGLSNIRIEHNTVDMREWDQTSAVMIDNYFGPINNVAVHRNLLMGGGYTVYSDGQFSGGSIRNVSFTSNRLGRGQWGYASIVRNQPAWTNNVDHSTGRAVRP